MPRIVKGSDYLALQLPAHLPPVSRALVALGVALANWEERRRTRQAMRRLDSRLLSDIGLDEQLRHAEVDKPFWRS